jgi:Flp pilus assembly protein protease CpaA
VQDYKTREVSNWITVPVFISGAVVIFLQHELGSISLAILLIFFWKKGWMGGADAKVLIGLLGLWFTAALAAFLAVGLWGAGLFFKKGEKSFPALVPITVGVGLTFLVEISIMPLN